ncbi:nuclear transport factor 2 family protein, partial [Longimicrobium sp.]|uniref:nuclear transport factor 2 family protein n=1 Tax=Longimicrobium sp. TaxID=2029185 RepID=UPI002E33BDB4
MSYPVRTLRFVRAIPFVILAACGAAPTGAAEQTTAAAAPSASQAVAPAGVRAAIERNNETLIAAFVAGDAAGAAALFAEDAVLLLPGVPALNGRAEIEQALAGAFTAVKYQSIVARIDEVQYFGDYALERGTTVMTYTIGGQTKVDHGK